MIVSSVLEAFVYACTAVATLRAGSRLTYIMTHKGKIGEMDGPRILGPSNLDDNKPNQKGQVDGDDCSGEQSLPSKDSQTEEVSPLWEVSFAFEKAIQFSVAVARGERNRDTTLRQDPSFFSWEDVIQSSHPAKAHASREKSSLLHRDDSSANYTYDASYPLSSYGVPRRIPKPLTHNLTTTIGSSDSFDEGCLEGNYDANEPDGIESVVESDDQKENLTLTTDAERLLLFSLPTPSSLIRQTYNVAIKAPASYAYGAYDKTKKLVMDTVHDIYFSGFYANWRRTPIQVSASSPISRRDQRLATADFTSCDSVGIAIPSTDAGQTHSDRKHIAQVTTYAAKAFSQLRSRFGIDEEEFTRAMQTPFVSFQSNSKGAARAGLFFFFTRDGAYMVKSIKRAEAKTFLRMIPKYYQYMNNKGRAKRTLLTRICGLYEVDMLEYEEPGDRTSEDGEVIAVQPGGRIRGENGRHILMVMNSVFPAEASQFIAERFDLKGSTVGRLCSEEERQQKGSNAVLKDLNLANEMQDPLSSSRLDEHGLHIGTRSKASLLSQLRQDVNLLIQCGVMDYSLLAGVVNMERDSDGILPNMPTTHLRNFALRREKHKKNKNADEESRSRLLSRTLGFVSLPIRAILAPPLFVLDKMHTLGEVTLSTLLTYPLPYYGSGICGVDGGLLSVVHGKRQGRRAVYYFGLIDFLQPWTARKVVEREIKGLLGYDKKAVSAVTPEEYGKRFISFLDSHVT
jgi:hypothetical protein